MIERVVFDGPDRVMTIGMHRSFTGALRRAIEVRDRTCTHPYCDLRADRCDADHALPYIEGGPTDRPTAAWAAPFTTATARSPDEAHPTPE